jgi:hypothetical protein
MIRNLKQLKALFSQKRKPARTTRLISGTLIPNGHYAALPLAAEPLPQRVRLTTPLLVQVQRTLLLQQGVSGAVEGEDGESLFVRFGRDLVRVPKRGGWEGG